MHLAIFEPDEMTAHVLAFVARRRGHRTATVPDLAQLPERLPFTPSVCFVALPQIDSRALELVAPLRERYPEAPLLLASERVRDATATLREGISDVIRKPFHPHEVILRAELHLAASARSATEDDAARVGDIIVDLDSYTARKNGAELPLTKLELRLLYCLLNHNGQVTPTERLLTFGWDSAETPDAALLKTHVSHLRKKLRDAGGDPFEIRSRHSLGYTFAASNSN